MSREEENGSVVGQSHLPVYTLAVTLCLGHLYLGTSSHNTINCISSP